MTRGRALVVALACPVSLLAAGCGEDDRAAKAKAKATSSGAAKATATSSGAAPKSAVNVDIASFKFAPPSVTLNAGGKMTWLNRDKAPHTAQNTGEKGPAQFDTGRLNTGQSKSVRFEKPGVYRYYCIYHRFMRASVTVVT